MATGTKAVSERNRFDEARLAEFLRKHVEEFDGPLSVLEFRGGQSNPTFLLSDGSRKWVLRRKPPGRLLGSAHAVDREFRVISALGRVDFPVPRARAFCDDESVIGTWFYVMDHVDGRIIADPLLPGLEPDERRSVYASFIDVLGRLHLVDHEAVGLADYGRPGNYFSRQIHRWTKQYRAVEPETPIPAMERLIDWLPAHVPEDDSATIVHGDYAFNNVILHPVEPRVVAVLDWELSTIGHPLGDLTYHLSQRRSPTAEIREKGDSELRALGIPTEAEYVDAYCAVTGREGVPQLEFYLAFQLFRMAGILQGIGGRVKEGTAAGEGAAELARAVPGLAEAALDHAAKLGA